MSETKTKKRTHQNLNGLVVVRLMEKYGFSRRYIQMSVRGERQSEASDILKKEYKLMCEEIDQLLKSKNELIQK
jgi:antitoxin component HigA of HigAB toxin-antitoxin module